MSTVSVMPRRDWFANRLFDAPRYELEWRHDGAAGVIVVAARTPGDAMRQAAATLGVPVTAVTTARKIP